MPRQHLDGRFAEPIRTQNTIIERYQLDIEWVASNRCQASYDWLDEEFYEGFDPTPHLDLLIYNEAA